MKNKIILCVGEDILERNEYVNSVIEENRYLYICFSEFHLKAMLGDSSEYYNAEFIETITKEYIKEALKLGKNIIINSEKSINASIIYYKYITSNIPNNKDVIFEVKLFKKMTYEDKIEKKVKDSINKVMNYDVMSDYDDTEKFLECKLTSDLCFDSLDEIEFIMELEKSFHIIIPDEYIEKIEKEKDITIKSIIEKITDYINNNNTNYEVNC